MKRQNPHSERLKVEKKNQTELEGDKKERDKGKRCV